MLVHFGLNFGRTFLILVHFGRELSVVFAPDISCGDLT